MRDDPTGHGESLVDMEQYLLPADRLRNAALHSWGVAQGLQVTAVDGAPGVSVSTGSAVDAAGRIAALTPGGLAVTDTADPTGETDIPTVTVAATGVAVDSAGLTGEVLLTISHREVAGGTRSAPVRFHAPFLLLQPEAGFQDVGQHVVLARVSLGPDGGVRQLTAGPRRLVGLPTGRVELRVPRVPSGPPLAVGQETVGELAAEPNGNVSLSVHTGGAAHRALTIDAATRDVSLAAALSVTSAVRISSAAGQGHEVSSGPDGKLHLRDVTADVDRLVLDGGGQVGIGIGAGPAHRVLHVEGTEVHSGGAAGGFSFADRGTGAFTASPTAGERWVWYAMAGTARLWSGSDRLTVSAGSEGVVLDVPRRMRVRQGTDWSAGIWFHQTAPDADRAFVGMVDDSHVGFWGPVGWGLYMDVRDGRVSTRGTLDVGAGTRADLLVRGDAVVGAGGNGRLAVRHVDGKSGADDAVDDLWLNWSTGRSVHVGGGARADLLVHGNAVVGAGGNGVLSVRHVDGKHWGGDAADDLWLNWSTGRSVHVGGAKGADLLVHSGPDSTSAVASWSGGGVAAWDVFARGAVFVGANPESPKAGIYSDGTVFGRRKPFVIDHPLDPVRRTLSHACVEGPELAVFYRGQDQLVGGVTEIRLPEYFEALVRSAGRTVQLTAVVEGNEPVTLLAASPVQDGAFTVRAADGRNPSQRFCWEVTAVRSDVDELVVEADRAAGSVELLGARS